MLKEVMNVKEYNRKERILKLIVEHFVKTAEPVGSLTLIEKYKLPYSSATIRNEMAELENLGYLEKTHTSSGRVPSAKGYRYYVDYLRDDTLDKNLKNQIQTVFDSKSMRPEDLVKHSCEIISSMTNLVSVVLGPDSETERMKNIQIVPLDSSSAVAIFVTDHGYVEHKAFVIPKGIEIKDLESTVSLINDRITGTPIASVVEKVNGLKPILKVRFVQHELLYKTIVETFVKFAVEHVSIYGRANIMNQPEFKNDVSKLKNLISLLEDDRMFDCLPNENDINVKIGSENDESVLDDMSVVTANINVGNNNCGRIALIGPKRMDYSNVLNAIEYLQQLIDDFNDEEEG